VIIQKRKTSNSLSQNKISSCSTSATFEQTPGAALNAYFDCSITQGMKWWAEGTKNRGN